MKIKSVTDRMEKLISDLLDYEKIRVGNLDINLQKENVRKLAQENLEMFSPLADKKSIKLEMNEVPENLFVICDRERINQVFSNLVGNALKFTPERGSVSIFIEEDGDQTKFYINDNGPGIPEKQLAHIFDRYWQAKNTARQGTGLGLSIAKGIMEAHNGELSVESQFGRGTSFLISLPICPD